MLNLYYTYLHRRQSDNAVFYIGKGKVVRAHTRHNRSDRWRKCVAKHGFIVEIVAPWRTEREALDHEVFLIDTFRAMGADLCNHTAGGEGVSGLKHSAQSKLKMAQAKIGSKQSPETIAARSAALRGQKRSEEVRAKLSRIQQDPGMRERLSKAMSSHTRSKEHEAKLRASYVSSERRAKISKAHTGVPKSPEHLAKLHKPVRCTTNGMEFDSLKSALAWLRSVGHLNANSGGISMVLTGKRKTLHGFGWEYLT